MLVDWSIEIAKGIGKLFLNPLSYWTILLFVWTGFKRIKIEREQFGTKVFNLFTEGQKTIVFSVVFSIIISLLAIFTGIVMSFETILLLALVTILVSITGSTTFLSASYTIGITFVLLILLPFSNVDAVVSFVDFSTLSIVHFISLSFLTGILLHVESLIVVSKTNKQTFPELSLSERGIWIGQHQIKALSFIPFLVLMPTEKLSILAPIWPYFHYGDQSFSLVLIPFLLGFQYNVRGGLPRESARHIGRATFWLSLFVLACAFVSIYIPALSFVAIIIAIVGKEWITYRHKMNDRKKRPFFTPLDKGIKVLATIPNSPADRLGIVVGETILKVNGKFVTSSAQLYEALQNSGAFFKLDVLDYNGEVRFINSAFYEEDHHKLGIIFPEKRSGANEREVS